MKNYILMIIVFLGISFISCNSSLQKKYNAATFENDIEEIRNSNVVSEEDMQVLVKYIVLARLSGNDLKQESYSDILDKIKSVNKTSDLAAEQQRNIELQKRERLEKFLNVSLVKKNFTKINNKQVLAFDVCFQNNSAQNIATIIGSIRLNDLLEREIKTIDIILDEPVHSHSTFKKLFIVNYNGDDETDKRIRSKSLTDMRIEWNPDKILFKDGKIAE